MWEKMNWWFLVGIILLGINIEPSCSTCYQPQPVKNGVVDVQDYPKSVMSFPNGTIARVSCKSGYRLTSSELKTRVCINREWTNNPHGDSVCVPEAEGHCGRPPPIINGGYIPIGGPSGPWTAWTTSSGATSALHAVGTTMQPDCESGYTLNCSNQCGKIKCDSDGSWVPLDGELITSCSAVPGGRVLGSVLNDSSSNGHGHARSDGPALNYVVLGLAICCTLVIAVVIIIALRRPLFCKKQGQSGGENPGVNYSAAAASSSLSCPPPLDSLPVAMNTGIFVPGAGYDLQDCHFQDVPIVGTTVFK